MTLSILPVHLDLVRHLAERAVQILARRPFFTLFGERDHLREDFLLVLGFFDGREPLGPLARGFGPTIAITRLTRSERHC